MARDQAKIDTLRAAALRAAVVIVHDYTKPRLPQFQDLARVADPATVLDLLDELDRLQIELADCYRWIRRSALHGHQCMTTPAPPGDCACGLARLLDRAARWAMDEATAQAAKGGDRG